MTSASTTLPRRTLRFDRPVLVSNVASGALWLVVLAALGAWPLVAIGAPYVVAASLFLASVRARETLTTRQETLAWALPWLAAVALWAVVIGGIEFANTPSHYLVSLAVGLLVGTGCYVVWQILALAIRQVLALHQAPASRSD